MLNVGVVGCGHLGKIHIQLIVKSSQFNLSGIYDSNIEISKSLANEFSCRYYENIDKSKTCFKLERKDSTLSNYLNELKEDYEVIISRNLKQTYSE